MAGVLIGLALLAFWLFSLFDVITTPEEEVQQSPKAVWLIIVAAVPIVGGVFWMMRGRPKAVVAARPVAGEAGVMPKGPDDDPDFLKELERRLRGESEA
ncbi:MULTISPECIES: PLD nuclease N-terminal domain-containing protein [Nonomuraea]|uniref:PLD nuclease N-terminal domain-containing protein n=3 Tax=Nonomuraea TaxID=83681 RepID=A0ABW1C2Z0_9ACTN|nr:MULTISPECIES: PLD nuclease N-terminal domain-containing protein [Nonomuraea]MDA0639215.1 PLD nuclease N-terminal domain-containing protein [Nonomuraea ferruginea]TXK35375.1 PLDc_N domain-containing protein [Nonomuraea sp. C10]